jgi:hypothetical protein
MLYSFHKQSMQGGFKALISFVNQPATPSVFAYLPLKSQQ